MEQSENKLTSVVFENLKELIKGKNAAHESMFKFHWKKLWPFNLIWPQVDYLRIQRFMENIGEESQKQKEFIKQNTHMCLHHSSVEIKTIRSLKPPRSSRFLA